MRMIKAQKILLVTALILVLPVVLANKNHGRVDLISKPSAMAARFKNSKRLVIVRCCGNRRCSDVTRKKLMTTALTKKTTITNVKKHPNSTTIMKEVETTEQETTEQTLFATREELSFSTTSSQPESTTEIQQTPVLTLPEPTVTTLDASSEPTSSSYSTTYSTTASVTFSTTPSIEENGSTTMETTTISRETTATTSPTKTAISSSIKTTSPTLTTTRLTTTRTTTTKITTTTRPQPCLAKFNCQSFGKMLSAKTPIPSSIAGSAFTSCGRSYFAGGTSVSLSTAATYCKAKNLSLLSIDSPLEFRCLLNLFKYLVKAYPSFSYYWTSGANEGDRCDDFKVYSWCSLNDTLLSAEFSPTMSPNNSLWSIAMPSNKTADRCLLFKFNRTTTESKGLQHLSCQRTFPYICEPACQKPNCPSSCDPDDSLFYANKTLIGLEYFVEILIRV
ncbi:uncharacterized protein LOC132205108 [Neocloeon triangulifer]|uniref:uncharacterized protein LOC132205108 n=1 Tax=Neocloeon triangulifer TaxID=2078957 RepID=UPI00286F3F41|nr:uncharacterized protein LOC132205108 [Neocloeon triangulifer]